MSFPEIWDVLRLGFLPVAVVVAICIFSVYVLARFGSKLTVANQLIFITGFGLLGGLLGYSAGSTQQSIIGTVLPTLLTFITILLGFLFTKEEKASPLQPVIPHCLLVLMLSSLLCLFLGGIVKRQNDEYRRRYDEYLLHYEKVDLELEKAKKLNELAGGQNK